MDRAWVFALSRSLGRHHLAFSPLQASYRPPCYPLNSASLPAIWTPANDARFETHYASFDDPWIEHDPDE